MVYNLEYNDSRGQRGFATQILNNPIFGDRDRLRVTNTIRADYTFNPFHALSLNFRHYWDTVKYDGRFFTLKDNGRLELTNLDRDSLSSDPDVNFSTWNIDLSYSWQFAPGSFLTALYRNQLFNVNDNTFDDFDESLDNLFMQPALHNFSLRLQYFIDFNGIKSVFKKNTVPELQG